MMTGSDVEPPAIPPPIHPPRPPATPSPAGAVDCHAHIFGPSDHYPYTPGRGYTPPDAPIDKYLEMLDGLGFARGVCVQGNAHGFDNRAILNAVGRAPDRLRAVGICDRATRPDDLKAWHAIGMRGLRFHLYHPDHKPTYVRGVGLDVFEDFRPTLTSLGWHMQCWVDWRQIEALSPILRGVAADLPIVIDHMLNIDAQLGVGHPSFRTLVRLLEDGVVWVKLSGAYRVSKTYPDYPDARPLHEALVAANPERLVWGTDWPHPQMTPETMPDDGHLLDLFNAWTPDATTRQRILVENPCRLYDFPPFEDETQ